MNSVISIKKPKSAVSEMYRCIRTNIEISNVDKKLKVIGITSSKEQEGKTTVISNIAASFANIDKKVLILDGNFRNPSIHKIFRVSKAKGITDILAQNATFMECVQYTKLDKLHVLSVGQVPPNPAEILTSNNMKELIEELKNYYDYIFIDGPPIGMVADASIIASYSDGTIFVIGANQVDKEVAQVAKDKLDTIDANIVGAVLNKFEDKKSKHKNRVDNTENRSRRRSRGRRKRKRKGKNRRG